jgi:D-beta-D-heptose 7-phosphate kinase/D-beta-D-heptose 1-phosphate adenosyltransferase
MVLFERDETPHYISAQARQVFDVSGAGDTVLAVFGLAIASGGTFREAAALANMAGRIVVGKVGTATVTREELRGAVDQSGGILSAKMRSLGELIPIADRFRAEGKVIVLTNGCFDLLHVGHIRLLAASRKLGDLLIVAIDDDASVRTLKGPGRPIIGAEERLRIISALDTVDYVTLFSTNKLKELIEALRPDILTKGSNYTDAEVSGREVVERLGGRVILVPITDTVSSTGVINQIKEGKGAD